MIFLQEEIWCCCKEEIVCITSEGEVTRRLYYDDERGERIKLDCLLLVQQDVWGGCSHSGP